MWALWLLEGGFESLGGSEVLKIGWWRRACAGDGLGALG